MPLSIKRRVTLDLSRTGYQVTIPFMKSDRVAHEVYITVKDGTEPVILPPGTMAAITVFNGVEGGVVDNLVVDHVNNVLMYVPSPNALAVAGNVKCTLTLFDELGAVIGAPSMIFGVMNSDTEEIGEEIQAALEANPSWGLIVTAAQSAESAKASSNEASQAAVEANASEIQAEFYYDMAKLKAEAAADSAAAAAASAESAEGSATAAAASAESAADSATAAEASEESAAESATAAEASAQEVANARAEIDIQLDQNLEVANTALTVAKGATQALVFIDLNDVCLTLNESNDPEEFNVGQNLLIRQYDVPDLWITGKSISFRNYNYVSDEKLIKDIAETHELQIGYYYVDFLETQKVDLSEYFKRKEAERVVYETLRQANQTGDFDGRNAQIAYSANEDGSDFTLAWQPGQKYIGFAIDYEAPLDKSAYEWVYIGSVALSVSVKNNKLVVSQQGNAYSATVQNGVLIFK